MYHFYLRLLQQAFIDMENMFEMLAEKQDVSGTCYLDVHLSVD